MKNSLTKNTSVLMVLVLTAFLALTGAFSFGVAAQDEQVELVIYGMDPTDVMDPRLEHFKGWVEDKYGLNVDVQYTYASATTTYQRVKSESGNPHADVVLLNAALASDAIKDDLVRPYYASNWQKMPNYAKMGSGRFYATYSLPYVFIYNNNFIDEEEAPDDWPDLLNEKWKGDLILRDPTESGTAGNTTTAIWAVYGEEKGKDFLYRLDEQVDGDYYGSSTKTVLDVARGAAKLSFWNEYYSMSTIYEKGYDSLSIAYPDTWMVASLVGAGIVENAPHPAAAELYLEYATSQEGMVWAAENLYRRPTLQGIPDEMMPEWLANAPKDLSILNFNWAKLGTVRSDWLKEWNRTVRGQGKEYVQENPERPDYEITEEFLYE